MFRLLMLLIGCFALSACSGPKDVHETRFIMGTLVEFTIADSESEVAEKAIATAANEMQRIENAFTIYGTHANSVKTFNQSQVNAVVELPDEVSQLLRLSIQIKQQSLGAFDPAIGALNLLWGFSSESSPVAPPSRLAIELVIPPSRCITEGKLGWTRLDEHCLLDFGAIAKGYAIDRGIETFKEHGIQNAIINAGGDIRLIGNHSGKPWRIGIRHPRNKAEVIETLELEGDAAVVTSGDYERLFTHQGRPYHHIIDPATGWPATGSQSATVIASTAALADAWSTALFVLAKNSTAKVEAFQLKALVVDGQSTIVNTLRQE